MPDPDLVVAVDGGFDRCTERGWRTDVLVGDFDSLSVQGLQLAESAELELVRLPADKDWSDLQAAFELAIERGATDVTAIGVIGGRLDHQLAVLGVLSRGLGVRVVALGPLADAGQPATDDVIHFLHAGDHVSIRGGATFSIIALDMGSQVSVSGARWSLDSRQIEPFSSLGLSNVALDGGAEVACELGVVLVIVPSALS